MPSKRALERRFVVVEANDEVGACEAFYTASWTMQAKQGIVVSNALVQ